MAGDANWWNSLDGDTKQAMILAGANAASGYFNNRAEDARLQDTRRDAAIGNRAEGINQVQQGEQQDYQFAANRNDSNAVNASRMSGNSPLEFQGDRAKMSALRDMLGGAGQFNMKGATPGHISKHMPTGAAMSPFSSQTFAAMSPEAMAAAEKPYWAAQQNIDPRLKSPDLGAMGYGEAGSDIYNELEGEREQRLATRGAEDAAYQASAQQRREALLAALDELGPEGEDDQGDGNGGSGSTWKNIAKYGTAAGLGYLGARYA